MCGIVGIALEDVSARAAIPIFYALYSLQHRGQESAGIATVSGTASAGSVGGSVVHLERGMGLVSEVFRENLSKLKGNIGIGHVRYSTTGASTLKNAEPLVVDYRDGRIAIAHNGNIVNASQLRNELKKEGRI
ncbi:MAG: class II glutamine amidotransferase, partial [Methanophagales archaeon]|nr:class II glutamine amidotransferase [Methanophagales archaeon]